MKFGFRNGMLFFRQMRYRPHRLKRLAGSARRFLYIQSFPKAQCCRWRHFPATGGENGGKMLPVAGKNRHRRHRGGKGAEERTESGRKNLKIDLEINRSPVIFPCLTLRFYRAGDDSRPQTAVGAICGLCIFSDFVVIWRGG